MLQDISDDDEAKSKAKIADALGVDWTQLMTAKATQELGTATSQVFPLITAINITIQSTLYVQPLWAHPKEVVVYSSIS